MTDDDKAQFKHAHITGQAMRDHWGPIVDRIADEVADPRDAHISELIDENERLREALESVLPSLEHYCQIAIENGHPEFIEAAMLALRTAYATLGDEV